MNEGERMVWAAVFAQKLVRGLRDPPSDIVMDRERWQKWEEQQVHSAVEGAAHAVEHMREALPGIEEGWGADHHIAAKLREMLGGKP